MNDWLSGTSGRMRRKTTTSNEEIGSVWIEWFVKNRARGVPLSGPMIQGQALKVATELGKADFKASNGWLQCFKNRHNIVWNSIWGESKDVDAEVVNKWKMKIPVLLAGYSPNLPTKTFSEKGDICGKMSRGRLTIFVCANMAGEMEKLFVMGKARRPRCFGNLDCNSLPIVWRANKKAWMTGTLMEEWFVSFNSKMKVAGRKVLLFLDNATCHPHIRLSNVQLEWFPANTTSVTQPMDQGVINNLKVWFIGERL